jgi:hypothetical protein
LSTSARHAQVLTEDGHVHATYPLCGSDLLSGHEVAGMIRAGTGATIEAVEISPAQFLQDVWPDGAPHRHTVDGLMRLFTYYGLRGITGNANVLRWLLGREPTTFSQYVARCVAGERIAV